MIRVFLSVQFLVLSTIIFYLSGIPGISLPDIHINDKIIHASVFLIYGISTQLAVISWFPAKNWRWRTILAIVIALTFAASDELHQSMVPGRMAELGDFAADSVGIVLSTLFRPFLEKLFLQR